MIDRGSAFILLDDARPHNDAGCGPALARLYTDPVEILVAQQAQEVVLILERLREAQAQGLYAAGYLGYEAGAALESRSTSDVTSTDMPLAWFGLFKAVRYIEAQDVTSWLPDPAGAWLGPFIPECTRATYDQMFETIQRYIAAGDIYQANLTFRSFADFAGDPMSLYAALRAKAAAGYGGIIWTGQHWHLSFSPELFFSFKDQEAIAKPMKGTAKRHSDPTHDVEQQQVLVSDPKQRAENLMIVDLLRNDLSRVCIAGSVKVPVLFKIESYPTIHQMVSVVTGQLQPDKDIIDLIKATFPCGSITGAPKIRAMDIIQACEQSPRHIYCGSIGRIDPDGSAAFNVAIRTLSLKQGSSRISLGLGSGIVADSDRVAEWQECLAKGAFADVGPPAFDLIETMRFEPEEGILRLELHLARMKESAGQLGFAFDRHATRNALHAASFHLEQTRKIRLLLSSSGAIAIDTRPVTPDRKDCLRVGLVQHVTLTNDLRRWHKTTNRDFYDQPRLDSGCDELLFVDPDGYLTEGSFTALFVERDGILLTPPLSRGVLPSVLCAAYLEAGTAQEAELRVEDLAGGFFVGNSLRGLMAAYLVE